MSQKTRATIVPNRFRQEPLDAVAYDMWQDHEGLADASKRCRVAWEQYRGEWRRVRKEDLRPVPLDPIIVWLLTDRERHLVRRARALGSAFAMCHADQRKPSLNSEQRAVWFRWRSRCHRSDVTVWSALWRLVDGEPLVDVAARFDVDPETLGKKVCKQIQWLGYELYPTTVRCSALYRRGNENSPLKSSSP